MKNFFIIILSLILLTGAVYSATEDLFADEDFFRVEEQIVLSASRRPQKLSDAPVSISVITRQEIENLGVHSIPEALVMAAGVYVQRNTNSQYEVGLRGTVNMPGSSGPFASLSRRILVLIDGRSFFNDFWGGTIWEFLPITLNDIERIEVVRGPSLQHYLVQMLRVV
jgi:iron complex outermembrane recepter protein